MANCGKEILLAREGTEQQQRFIEALEPGFFRLNDFELKDWMKFAFRFAEHVNYFNTANTDAPSGNWQDFFKSDSELEEFLKNVEEGKTITPHLALFVSFVKLIGFTQKRFNNLTKRHLDFYYRNILKIEKLPATPDKVHVIFELAKNSVDEKIAEVTELDGGKDATGAKRIYKTEEELIANKTKVASLKSVYNDHTSNKIKSAAQANSYDGVGGDFPDDDIKWWPFGYYGDANYPELPDAKLGFALSGEILELQEGDRNVQITVELESALNGVSQKTLTDNIEILCSGENEWLGPFSPEENISLNDTQNFKTGLNSAKKKITLAFQIPKDEEAVVKYDSEILGESFSTKFPVCRVLFKTEKPDAHSLYRKLIENEVKALTIDVNVRDIKSVLLESDIGTLNSEKPFYPFGTQPVKNSNFYIDYPELFKKEWTNFGVKFDWKNTPDNFVDLYSAYKNKYRYNLKPIEYTIGSQITDLNIEQSETIKKLNEKYNYSLGELSNKEELKINIIDYQKIVQSDAYFKAKVEVQNKEEWDTTEKFLTLFQDKESGYSCAFEVENDNYETDKNGPVRLSLNQSFLHELFPRIYAVAFSGDEVEESLIPNEPYTPMAENVLLSYSAQTSAKLDKSEYAENELKLFHEHPFGQSEEHASLKNQLEFLTDVGKKTFLVPTYCKGGELYIGLDNVETLQTVSLLVQVMEGSENPEADSFVGKQKVEWSVLCSNEWKALDSNYMIANETDNFLKSGIVKFSVPKEATQDNSTLSSGKIWVKAKTHKNYDAVCKVISIQAQAVKAEFEDNNNELSHLENGLPAKSISKLVQRISSVKSVSQPFSSFGGKPEESDAKYYRRISERLRHKNRAITLWDYEHLVLQEFPEIHKVKCLNHTSEDSFLSPGNVQLVVIPDIVNQNVFDIYQPRVSKAMLNKIQDFVNKLNTLHVNTVVINPDYEEVTVDLKVKFHKGFDENYYKNVLNDDITKLLSPWAFEKTAGIQFGVILHRSVVINYIEKLEYVDYLENVKLTKGSETGLKNVSPSSPRAILVSAKEHVISTDVKGCETVIETEETCQT